MQHCLSARIVVAKKVKSLGVNAAYDIEPIIRRRKERSLLLAESDDIEGFEQGHLDSAVKLTAQVVIVWNGLFIPLSLMWKVPACMIFRSPLLLLLFCIETNANMLSCKYKSRHGIISSCVGQKFSDPACKIHITHLEEIKPVARGYLWFS
jgi:hypothetical protein